MDAGSSLLQRLVLTLAAGVARDAEVMKVNRV
jgi:hypothetical protein